MSRLITGINTTSSMPIKVHSSVLLPDGKTWGPVHVEGRGWSLYLERSEAMQLVNDLTTALREES